MLSISAANTAALSPLSRPTAATGIPGGICTIERMASMLTLPLTGTPITGLAVNDAMTPGSAADSPAMAMNTFASDPFTRSSTFLGLLVETYSPYFDIVYKSLFKGTFFISYSFCCLFFITSSNIIMEGSVGSIALQRLIPILNFDCAVSKSCFCKLHSLSSQISLA